MSVHASSLSPKRVLLLGGFACLLFLWLGRGKEERKVRVVNANVTRPVSIRNRGQSIRQPLEVLERLETAPSSKPAPLQEPLEEAPDPRRELLKRLPFLLHDLRDDHVPGNATRAVLFLREHEAREDVNAALEGALFSADEQERQFAARILRERYRNREPSQRLIEVNVESLRHSRERSGIQPFACNAGEAVDFLLRHGDEAWEPLLAELDGSDDQARFLSATLLAHIDGARAPAERIVPILVARLRDNQIPNDANLASGALSQLGERIVPRLKRALPAADRQARLCLLNLLHALGETDLGGRRDSGISRNGNSSYFGPTGAWLRSYDVNAFEDR